MRSFNKVAKAGMIIMLTAGMIMALLVVLGRPVPDLAAWLFFVGLAVSVVFTLFVKKS